MKRSTLKPGKPLVRTCGLKRSALKKGKGMKRGRRKGDRPELRREWAMEHMSCAACFAFEGAFDVGPFHVHHILGGKWSRPDEKWNFNRYCASCHEKLDHSNNIAINLRLKRESDPQFYSRAAMQEHMKRFGKDLLPRMASCLPDWIIEARRANGYGTESQRAGEAGGNGTAGSGLRIFDESAPSVDSRVRRVS